MHHSWRRYVVIVDMDGSKKMNIEPLDLEPIAWIKYRIYPFLHEVTIYRRPYTSATSQDYEES
jgi:hypothetical protein